MKALFLLFIKTAFAVTINPNIPAVNPGSLTNPGSIVSDFYQFALMIAGVLALGAIVYGGVKYATSAGNPSAQSEGKEWILSALYGLLLLAGAYIILYTINPNLVNLNPPVLSPVASNSAGTPGTGTNATCGTCPQGTTCDGSGSCVSSTGSVACAGKTSGTCPNSSDACVNQGDTFNPNYSCQPTNQANNTCGGAPPNSKFGSCAPLPGGQLSSPVQQCCNNSNAAQTANTIQWKCGSCS